MKRYSSNISWYYYRFVKINQVILYHPAAHIQHACLRAAALTGASPYCIRQILALVVAIPSSLLSMVFQRSSWHASINDAVADRNS